MRKVSEEQPGSASRRQLTPLGQGGGTVLVVADVPSIEDRLVLALVVGPAERERVLRLDHER